jgi:hypothetical protein
MRVCAHVRASVRVCVCVCARSCARVRECTYIHHHNHHLFPRSAVFCSIIRMFLGFIAHLPVLVFTSLHLRKSSRSCGVSEEVPVRAWTHRVSVSSSVKKVSVFAHTYTYCAVRIRRKTSTPLPSPSSKGGTLFEKQTFFCERKKSTHFALLPTAATSTHVHTSAHTRRHARTHARTHYRAVPRA